MYMMQIQWLSDCFGWR